MRDLEREANLGFAQCGIGGAGEFFLGLRYGVTGHNESRPGHFAGCDKVRVNHSSLDSPLVILANQALEVVAVGKTLHIARAPRSADYIDAEPTGLEDVNVWKPNRWQCHSVTHLVTA